MKRRSFLAASVAMGYISTPSFAQNDFSQLSQREQILAPLHKRYALESYDSVVKSSLDVMQNKVLPNSYSMDFWDQPRSLYLKDPATAEVARVTYFENGSLNHLGYNQAIYFLRDKRARLVANHDLRLLDLMCAVQAWMRVYGNNQPLIITSGYRTHASNAKLEEEGSVKNSMHTVAKAVDFVVPGMDPRVIGKIASAFEAGGVGVYVADKFNHLDTARVKSWTRYTSIKKNKR